MPKKSPIVSKNAEEGLKVLCLRVLSAIEVLAPHQDFITIGLSGGSFIQQLSTELPKHLDKLAPYTSKLRIIFCDERFVPENDPDSTFYSYTKQNFFAKLNIAPENVFNIDFSSSASVEECANAYEAKLKPLVNQNGGFDILLLGMGPDGHTCSIFPDHASFEAAKTSERVVIACTNSPKPPPNRVTLTLSVINKSSYLIFNAFGEAKAEILKKILVDEDQTIPSALVKPSSPNGLLLWFIDQPAAKYI
jgi:6-phosphogluconolactonase